ncbi:sensor histidine kinase [Larkinella soli]|uniref:sensor histidine kinase n=1 Tax=Larkinella soli TaxID=1770527 RepID=UPI0013E327AF|nr:HAMP domain-containing sensor histidine kinase [Larkinella soli]
MTSDVNQPTLEALGIFLSARRDALLNHWRTACDANPAVKITALLSREEFNNKTPYMLNVLQQRLRGQPQEGDIRALAAEHGLHRWQKGYELHALLEEMGQLHSLLLEEFNQFWLQFPNPPVQTLTDSYGILAWLVKESNAGSVEQYSEVFRLSALSRSQSLELTLSQLQELLRQRGTLLRRASHDLRSSFGIIQGAVALMDQPAEPTGESSPYMEMLQRNLTGVREMITQLMDLSRLEAGQETPSIQTFDASHMLQELVANVQPLAQQRGLILQAEGPEGLEVECDRVMVQRMVQNLVMNALEHTPAGWITVSWSRENDFRWYISVQDSGPGLSAGAAGQLQEVLSPNPESSAGFGMPLPVASAESKMAAGGEPSGRLKGEGIGLSIVKGLCELLRGTLEVETRPGEGTLFRIRLGIHWQA